MHQEDPEVVRAGRRTFLIADVEPLDVDGVRTLTVGTAAWFVLFLGLLPFYPVMRDQGDLWWLWTCLTGAGLGLIGLDYCRRKRDKRTAAAADLVASYGPTNPFMVAVNPDHTPVSHGEEVTAAQDPVVVVEPYAVPEPAVTTSLEPPTTAVALADTASTLDQPVAAGPSVDAAAGRLPAASPIPPPAPVFGIPPEPEPEVEVTGAHAAVMPVNEEPPAVPYVGKRVRR